MNTSQKYPKISIVTPSYNQGQYLEDTILSVLNQNYPNLEYIIIDGGSSDESVAIIKKYEAQIDYWVSEPDNGMYQALNKGFKQSSGEILGWINSDDIFYEGALHIIAEIFTKLNNVDWISGRCGYIDKKGVNTRTAKKKIYNKELLKSGFYKSPYAYLVNQNVVFWRSKLWDKVGGLDENLKSAADFVLWTKFAEHSELFYFDSVFSAFRNHGENLTYRLGVYAAEAKPFMTFSTSTIIKLLTGKQFYGFEIIETEIGDYSIRSVKLNPKFIKPFHMARNILAQFVKTNILHKLKD